MPDLPQADRLVLLSPMIGVSPFARFAWMMSVFGWVPYFEQSRWLDVLPEYLPFKYTSFPVNAGRQTYRLTTALSEALEGRGVEPDSRSAADPHVPVAGRHDRAHRRGRPRAVRPARRRRQRAGAVRRQPAIAHRVVLPRRLGGRRCRRCLDRIA